jgi:hypothetical protein
LRLLFEKILYCPDLNFRVFFPLSKPSRVFLDSEGWVMHARNHSYLLFILILSILALVALAAEATLPLTEGTRTILHYADMLVCLVCLVFFVDFVILLYCATDKKKYILTWGWVDLASSVPMLVLR